MIILGLDIATVTGFACYESGSSLSSIKTVSSKPSARTPRRRRNRSVASFAT